MKNALKFSLAMLPFGLIGGFLVSIYSFEHYTPDMQALVLEQMSYEMLIIVSALQGMLNAGICAFFGHLLAVKINLWKPFRFEKKTTLWVSSITLILGILFVADYWVFGSIIPEVAADYAKGISPAYFFGALIYGGVVEELMMRLFLMSLLIYLLWRIAGRKYDREHIPEWIPVSVNVVIALLFAAGHLPATISLFGGLSFPIVFRCFLLNGSIGLVFGRFYRKYGIQYAMLSHFGCHLVSKLILLMVL